MPQTTGKRLVEALNKQLDKIEYFSSMENVSPNVAVHELRKTFKRMRALMQFYTFLPDSFPEDYKMQLRYFGQSFSKMRESYVNIQVFERIAAGDLLIPERKIKTCRDKLIEKNRELLENGFVKAEADISVRKFAKTIGKQTDAVRNDFPSDIHLLKQLEKSFLESYKINRNISIDSDPDMFHELRKKLKQLMYQLDFVRFVQPRFFKTKSFQLNTITEQLGEDHDLFIFLQEIKNEEYEFDKEELMIIENKIQHLREINQVKLFPRLKQFFNEPPQSFGIRLNSIFKMD